MSSFFSALHCVDRWFARAIEFFLICALLLMVSVTFLQVVLRMFFHSGIVNAEIISRHMVLWIAFLGAMLGTRNREHIAIDAIMKFLPRRSRNGVRILVDAASSGVAFFLAKASFAFVLNEKEMGELFAGMIPLWWVQMVIPFGFAVIALEYAIGVVLDAWRMIRRGPAHTAGEWRKYISR